MLISTLSHLQNVIPFMYRYIWSKQACVYMYFRECMYCKLYHLQNVFIYLLDVVTYMTMQLYDLLLSEFAITLRVSNLAVAKYNLFHACNIILTVPVNSYNISKKLTNILQRNTIRTLKGALDSNTIVPLPYYLNTSASCLFDKMTAYAKMLLRILGLNSVMAFRESCLRSARPLWMYKERDCSYIIITTSLCAVQLEQLFCSGQSVLSSGSTFTLKSISIGPQLRNGGCSIILRIVHNLNCIQI